MPMRKRSARCEKLGERIITYKGERVCTPDYNFSCNIRTGRVQCSCDSIILLGGWQKHTLRPICVEYHKTTNTTARIINHLV
jgi:hypothetical protein